MRLIYSVYDTAVYFSTNAYGEQNNKSEFLIKLIFHMLKLSKNTYVRKKKLVKSFASKNIKNDVTFINNNKTASLIMYLFLIVCDVSPH